MSKPRAKSSVRSQDDRAGSGGPKGFSPEVLIRIALDLHEKEGPEGFGVRALARCVGCDPMAVIYHFGSKEGLERAMADAINAELRLLDRSVGWRDRLRGLAMQYRDLALRYPRSFSLLTRFWVTGPADYRHAEEVYAALKDAGNNSEAVVDLCFGWYASVLGLATAEAGGLLRPASEAQLREVRALSPTQFPITTGLLSQFERQEAGRVYALMVDMLIEAIASRTSVGGGAASTRRGGRRAG
ncbi:MAG: TetR/AcrR family transcriptional regulator [Planctomycetota bacterium]|nr:TetR/AcrR family transcriptional regulator [Planctomycetota bacterium]